MEKNNKVLFMVLGVLLVIGVTSSFAYFLVSVVINGNGANINADTANLVKVQYDAGSSKLEGEGLFPKDKVSKEFKVIVTPTNEQKEVTYRIYMNITENTFKKCTEETYIDITNECEINANELVYRLKDSAGNIIKEGDLTGITGEVEIGRITKTQDVKTEYEYTIEIEYVDTNKDQNHNKNAVINGEIKVEFAEKVITIPDIIAANNPKDTTPDFSQVAVTDKGVYAVSDEMYGGTSYYWRGAVTNNYVKFAEKCWRIVRINGDGSIRLIYDGSSCHANGTKTTESLALTEVYNASDDKSEYVGWTYEEGSQRPSNLTTSTDSNAKTQLESWYSSNITGTNATKVADGKFCNDRNAASGYSWSSKPSNTFYYAGYDRSGAKSASSVTPTLSCPSGDIYTLKAGLITMDEVVMAGSGKYGTSNSYYYLYNGQSYWTMSPFYGYGFAYVLHMTSAGQLADVNVDRTCGVRPVINLKSNTLFRTGGTGTLDNPYVVI